MHGHLQTSTFPFIGTCVCACTNTCICTQTYSQLSYTLHETIHSMNMVLCVLHFVLCILFLLKHACTYNLYIQCMLSQIDPFKGYALFKMMTTQSSLSLSHLKWSSESADTHSFIPPTNADVLPDGAHLFFKWPHYSCIFDCGGCILFFQILKSQVTEQAIRFLALTI